MNAKQFHDELAALVERAFKDGVRKQRMTPEAVAQILLNHGQVLARTIQQARDEIQSAHIAKAIVSPIVSPID